MRDVLPVFLLFFLQRHPAGLPGRAAEELRGHAGADAWREGFSGDWLPAGEGKRISTGVQKIKAVSRESGEKKLTQLLTWFRVIKIVMDFK